MCDSIRTIYKMLVLSDIAEFNVLYQYGQYQNTVVLAKYGLTPHPMIISMMISSLLPQRTSPHRFGFTESFLLEQPCPS
jgi:hypothetical protein